MTLRVGIIGAGQAGERHAVGFSVTEGARLVGIADSAPERAQALASRFGAAAYSDWRAMLDRGLDVLVVALPHNMHVAPTEAAAAQGAHVLMEKPIATTLADARRIVDVCERAGVQLSISFVHRFREETLMAKRWIGEGRLGTIQIASEQMAAQRGAHLAGWISSKEMAGGGVLMYSAIHGIDRLRWLLSSEVRTVSAQTRISEPGAEVEDGVAALLTFESGAVATLNSNAPLFPNKFGRWETELYGSAGMLRIRTRQFLECSCARGSERLEIAALPADAPGGEHYNFARQAAAFVESIRAGRTQLISGADGLRALEIALAIYQSAETGQTVNLP